MSRSPVISRTLTRGSGTWRGVHLLLRSGRLQLLPRGGSTDRRIAMRMVKCPRASSEGWAVESARKAWWFSVRQFFSLLPLRAGRVAPRRLRFYRAQGFIPSGTGTSVSSSSGEKDHIRLPGLGPPPYLPERRLRRRGTGIWHRRPCPTRTRDEGGLKSIERYADFTVATTSLPTSTRNRSVS